MESLINYTHVRLYIQIIYGVAFSLLWQKGGTVLKYLKKYPSFSNSYPIPGNQSIPQKEKHWFVRLGVRSIFYSIIHTRKEGGWLNKWQYIYAMKF